MALQKDITTSAGVNAPTSYIVIEDLVYLKKSPNETVNAKANAYMDLAARNAGKEPIQAFNFNFSVDVEGANNFIAQGYTALKTLPELVGAIDV